MTRRFGVRHEILMVAVSILGVALLLSVAAFGQTATDIKMWYDVSSATPPNIKLNTDTTTQLQNEEQVAVDPTNPDNLVAVWRDFRLGYRQIGWGYSHNGGVTWTEGGLVDQTPYGRDSDPGITVNSAGVFYSVILSFEDATPANGLFVPVSLDSGRTWAYSLTGVDTPFGPSFEDKELITCDRTGGPTDGSLYIAWTRFGDSTGIYCVRSTDGFSFGVERPVSDRGSVQWPTPAVGNDGRVVIAWYSYSRAAIMCDISLDQGWTWGTDRVVAPTSFSPGTIDGGITTFPFPALTADVTDGPYDGRFYCAFADRAADGLLDLYMTISNDSGKTWLPRVRLNDDPIANHVDQFHPWISVNPDGVVSVVFYDRRLDPSNLYFDVWVTHSFDGGQTWTPNQRVTNVSSSPFNAASLEKSMSAPQLADPTIPIELLNPNAGLIGEYIGLSTSRLRATMVFTDTRNLNQDVYAANMPLRLFPPKLAGPATGTITNNLSVSFSWADWSRYDSALTYVLEYSTDPSFATNVTRLTGIVTPARVESLPDGLYSWRVRAFDTFGDSSAVSAVRTVWVDATRPVAPTPVHPAPLTGDTITDSTPTFVWTTVSVSKQTDSPTPVTYQVRIASDPMFTVGLRSYSGIAATQFDLPLADKLALNQDWYWHVKAADAAGNQSEFSADQNFHLRATYILGDFNDDGALDVVDVVGLIDFVFSGGSPPVPPTARIDLNCDQVYDVLDVTALIDVVFQGAPVPVCP